MQRNPYSVIATEDPNNINDRLMRLKIDLSKDINSGVFYAKLAIFLWCITTIGGLVWIFTSFFHYDYKGWYNNSGRRTDLNGDAFISGTLTTRFINAQSAQFNNSNITGLLTASTISVTGSATFHQNVTFANSITVANEINLLNSKFTMGPGRHSIIEDNFALADLGSYGELTDKPIRFGNTNYNDLMLYSSKKMHLWEVNPEFFDPAIPLGGSVGLSMSLQSTGLFVNNAISAAGSQVGSSREIKENIVFYPEEEARTKLMSIKVRKYTYKQFWLDFIKKANITMSGFIAEEIRDEVDGTMVSEVLTTNEHLTNGVLVTLRKEDLHSIEIKNLQMLVQENVALQARVAQLESLFVQLNTTVYSGIH